MQLLCAQDHERLSIWQLAPSSWLHHPLPSFSPTLLLPCLLCGPEWQGDSRLGISQSLPSSSVPSACQPTRLLIPGRDGTLLGKGEKGMWDGRGDKAGLAGGRRGEPGGCGLQRMKVSSQGERCMGAQTRRGTATWERTVVGIKIERPHTFSRLLE